MKEVVLTTLQVLVPQYNPLAFPAWTPLDLHLFVASSGFVRSFPGGLGTAQWSDR